MNHSLTSFFAKLLALYQSRNGTVSVSHRSESIRPGNRIAHCELVWCLDEGKKFDTYLSLPITRLGVVVGFIDKLINKL